MSRLLTNWGYTVNTDNGIPDIMDVSSYNDYTASRYAGDERISPNISAVSQAIRNYCGWHVYPELSCEFEARLKDKRIVINGTDITIQLPATYVSSVDSVVIGDTEITSYYKETNGILCVYDVGLSGLHRYTPVVVTYTAGLPEDLMDAVRELAAHRVSHALAASYGVTSESSGGVSVTYNANWINSARSTALPDDNKEVLMPYRLQGVF